MRKSILSLVFASIIIQHIKSQTYTVSGYVTDQETRETLIGVTILVKESKQATTTDKNGFFRLTDLKNGDFTLQFSYVGYVKNEKKILVTNKSILLEESKLKQETVELKTITITGIKQGSIGDKELETSLINISPRTILNIPSAHGDVFKAIKYLPGIQATEPFSPLYSARGGDPSGNMVLLDGVAVYNPYHFTSADGLFNIQSIKDVDLLVGGFGAEFGGRNSSILYITTKDGNMNSLHGEVEPTTTHSKVFLEFPVGKNGSMMIAGRYFYDIPGHFIFGSNSYFYDFNVSYTARLNEKNRFTLKLFNSHDDFDYSPDRLFTYFDNSSGLDVYKDMNMSIKNTWNNKIVTAYLKTVISPDIYLKTQVYGSFHDANNKSDFDFKYHPTNATDLIQLNYGSEFQTNIHDICAKADLNIKPDSINSFKIGSEINNYNFFNSASIQSIDNGKSVRQPFLCSFFVEDKIKIGNLIIRPGIRASRYSFFDHWQFEPRLNLALNLPFDFKFRAAWGIYVQNIVSMNTQEYEISQFLDYYYPLKNLKPSKSIHYIAGIDKQLFGGTNLSIDAYYIDMPVTYTFDLNIDQLQASTFSDKLQKGNGSSYGLEFMWKGQYKKISGWLSYGLSRSTRSYPFIMNGKSFLFDFDRTHSFKTVLNYQATPDLTYNTSLVILSGLPKTVEPMMQQYFYYDPVTGKLSSYPFGVSDVKNNARLPSTIDLDIGIIKRIRKGFGAELAEFLKADRSYLTITIGNILFLRRNVIWYFPFGGNKYIPIGINYFPYVSAGYVIKF